MAASNDITEAPWRVETPLQPIEGESLDGFIARVAAASWIDNAVTITNLAGVMYGHKPTLATHGWDGLPVVADCLQVDVDELRRRSYPATDRPDRRRFFGVTLERRDIVTSARRFAPAALDGSPHHRALWQLRPFPFCSESWQYLLDQCPRCGAVQRWHHANGVDRCDRCVEELSLAEAEEVAPELRPALKSAIGLVHPDPAARHRSLGELPTEIRALGLEAGFELLLRLMGLVDGEMIRSRVGRASSWSMAPAAITSAMAKAWPLLAGWPHALTDYMAERIATAPTRHNDGNNGLSVRFLKLSQSPAVPNDVADLIARLRRSVQLDGPDGALIAQHTMGIKQVASALGRGTKEMAEIRRKGGLTTVFALNGERPVAVFDASEIRSVGVAINERVGFETAAWRIGISRHGVEQLVAMALLATAADRYCHIRYGSRQTTEAALSDFQSRLHHASNPDFLTTPITLRNAAKAIGGRLKPWGPIFRALLAGEIPFASTNEEGALSDNVLIERSDLPTLAAFEFDPFDYPMSSFESSMTRLDAGETLNLAAKAYTSAINSLAAAPDGAKLVRVCDVLRLATTHISASEIAMRLGISPRSAYNLANRAGVPLLGSAGWCRQETEKLIFPDAA